jgi:uncharacterized membrane protein (DUF4010 family)
MGWIVQEFRKRHLFVAALAYAAFAAAVLAGLRVLGQVAALPTWLPSLAVLLLALGLPLTLIAIWRRWRRPGGGGSRGRGHDRGRGPGGAASA